MGERAVSSIEMRTSGQEALDITPFVTRFVWSHSMIAGGFSWYLHFKASQWREWNNLMMGRDNPVHQFRLRSEEDESPQSTEWRSVIVDKSRAAFSQDTSMVAGIKGADVRLAMAQSIRTRAFTSRSASSVLTQLATEYNLTPDIDGTAGESDWIQAREDDWTFARRLARSAATESGRGDSYLWVDDDVLRFGVPELGELSDRQYDVSVVESRVDGYVGTYHGRYADRQGAATLIGMGFDFRTKSAVRFEMNAGTAQTHPSLAARVPRRMADGLRMVPVFAQERARVEEETRARWGRVAPRYLALRLRTRPDLTLRPGSIVEMQSNLDEGRETPFMGRYVVLEVQHVLEAGAVATTLSMYRREAQEGEAQPTGADADAVGTRDQFQDAGITPRTIVVAQEL